MKLNSNTLFTSLGMVMLLQACGIHPHNSGQTDSGKKGRVITVTSNPTGATIRANGNKLGETPLEVDLEKSFSRGWVRGEEYGVVYRINGALTIEKSGCSEYTVPVSETTPSDDISITLVCTEKKQTTSESEPVKPTKPVRSTKPTISTKSENVKQRLKRLEVLYQDGAISRDEYNQHRNRILGEL